MIYPILCTWSICCGLLCPLNILAPEQAQTFPFASPESQGVSSEALRELSEIVQDYVDANRTVGAELLVVKNRRTVFHEAFGWRDYEGDKKIPMERNTIFSIRSMTKSVIGTAVQMLIDEGRLSPDDPVHRYLPAFDTDKCRAITVKHLITHWSGLPMGPIMASYYEFKGIDEVAARAAEIGPEIEPGTGFLYSDPGSDTLGAVLEKASGQPIGAFVQERILDPLGMKDTLTLFDRDDPRAGRVPPLFAGEEGGWMRYWKPYHPLFPFTCGSQSLYATTVDYARFLLLWMDKGVWEGDRLLSEEAIERGLTPVTEWMDYPTHFKGLKPTYAQMWMTYIDAETEGEAIATAKREIISHSGSDGTVAWGWPERDLIICYFTQSRGGMTAIDLEAHIDRLILHPEEELETKIRYPELDEE